VRIYSDATGNLPESQAAADTVVKALGEVATPGQAIMAGTRAVTMEKVNGGWLLSPRSDTGLTPRESQIASGIAQGQTNHEIAEQLHLSVLTVKHYVTTLLRDGPPNRAAIVSRAWGLFQPDLLDHNRPLHRFRGNTAFIRNLRTK
jgi:DNA-binding CsgD family transcriptional regulator